MPTKVRKESDLDADIVRFRGKGIAFTATAGTTTSYDYKLTEARLIDGAEVFCKDHAFGDSLKFQIVDVDGVYAPGIVPPGTVLDEFITDWYMAADQQGQTQTRLSYLAEIITGLYIRLVYTSVGVTNVQVRCNLFLHKYSA